MISFKEYILITESLDTPEGMKKTFDNYFKHTKGMVSVDKRDRNRLNFSTSKSVASDIIATIDSVMGYGKNKYFHTSPVTKKDESDGQFHFSITFNKK